MFQRLGLDVLLKPKCGRRCQWGVKQRLSSSLAVSPVQDSLPVVRVTQRVWVRRCAEGTASEGRASLGNRWPEAKGVASHHPSVLSCGRSCPSFCDEFNLESSEVRARSRWFVFMTVVFFFRSLKKNCGDWCSALIGQVVVFAHLDVHRVVG